MPILTWRNRKLSGLVREDGGVGPVKLGLKYRMHATQSIHNSVCPLRVFVLPFY